MRVKIGNEWHAVEHGKPILVELSAKDKDNISNMHPDATMYAVAEDNEFASADDFRAWIADGKATVAE